MTPSSNSTYILFSAVEMFTESAFRKIIPDYDDIREEFQLFAKTDPHDNIVHLVVYMLLDTALERELGITRDSLLLLDKHILEMAILFVDKVRFKLNISLYNITDDGKKTAIYVPKERNSTVIVDKLYLLYRNRPKVLSCSKEKTIFFSKLHVCPYVVLELSDLSVNVDNDILYINNEYIIEPKSIMLSKWEYEIHGPELHVCLDTFISMRMYTSNRQISNPVVSRKIYLMCVSAFLYSVCLSQ